MTFLLGLATIAGSVALLVSAFRARRAPAAASYLAEVGLGAGVATAPVKQTSRITDVLRPKIVPLLPSGYVERLRRRIEIAGQSRALTAEEVATSQVILGVAGLGVGLMFGVVIHPKPVVALAALVIFPLCGVLGPKAWVDQAARERQGIVRRDLPDVLDLLAISVEAGLGFEAALELAARNFAGPLADELRRALREMELGSTRQDALHALKSRVDVTELSTFVTALTQADALGMPIGRVLHTQAAELRSRRRQWAREKAGKMPVKILFPLVAFIFPPILVILLGPAAVSIMHALNR